ncbi:MAG: hypothetical protein ACHQIM_00020 [Sphingobacteriales bacterium]
MPFKQFGYGQQFEGIVVDTNLLLLLLVGIYDKNLIKDFKRTLKYDIDDFERLGIVISYCKNQIYTTPNILTEITNLTDGINKDNKFFDFIHKFVGQFMEITNSSHLIMTNNLSLFLKLGLADASIGDISSEKILTITDDLDLYHFLSQSKPTINYNHLRRFR